MSRQARQPPLVTVPLDEPLGFLERLEHLRKLAKKNIRALDVKAEVNG